MRVIVPFALSTPVISKEKKARRRPGREYHPERKAFEVSRLILGAPLSPFSGRFG